VVFERTISQAAWTVPATASLLTSLDPQVHRVLRYNPDARLPDDQLSPNIPTLAEAFQEASYTTAALLKTVVVAKNRGLAQGFDSWRIVEGDMADKSSATQLTSAALDWIASYTGSRPFFLYLHYMDPHSNYLAPEPWYSQALGDYKGPITGGYNQIYNSYQEKGVIPTRVDLRQILAFYDAEIAYWDSEFGRLMVELVQSRRDQNTIVVVTADHGEAFYEHGSFFESHVFQENIAVPLIIKAPGLEPGRRNTLTESIDLAPTLLSLCGLPIPSVWQGQSQLPLSQEGNAYSEYGAFSALLTPAGEKLISGEGAAQLFDLFKDSTERRNLAAGHWKDVQRLKALLEARAASWPGIRAELGL
jgi:arylsulfatase A-like enzyme